MGNLFGGNQYPEMWRPQHYVEKTRPLNVRVFGARASGKTALVSKLLNEEKSPNQHSSYDPVQESLWNDGEIIFNEFSADCFRANTPIAKYIQRDAHYQIVLLVCDLTNQQECDQSIQIFRDKFDNLPLGARKVLVGAKADLVQWNLCKKSRVLLHKFWPETIAGEIISFFGGFEMMQNIAKEQGFYKYFETSAKTSENVPELFDWMQNLEWKYVSECGIRRLLE